MPNTRNAEQEIQKPLPENRENDRDADGSPQVNPGPGQDASDPTIKNN